MQTFLFAFFDYKDIRFSSESSISLIIFIYLICAMKKLLQSLTGIMMLSVLLGWITNAQLAISDLFYNGTPLADNAFQQVLNDYDSSWWFYNSSVIECENKNWINIVAPVVDDFYMDKVEIYRLFISPYRVSQLKAWDTSIDTSKVIIKEVTAESDADKVEFNISSSDVDPNTAYYGFILPIDSYDGVWIPSSETCFQLANNVCLLDTACDTLNLVINPVVEDTVQVENVDTHWAASCVGMEYANVSHTIKGGTITLTWTAVDGDTVEIAIWNPEEEVYKSLWTAKMTDEKFSYKTQWDWEQNFRLTNWCKDVYYKADAKMTPDKEEIVPAATGPAENVMYIVIAAIVLYWVYVLFFRKAEN